MSSFLGGITRQWQLKLLAFALAVLLWVVVTGEQPQSYTIPVALDIRVSDPDYELVDSSVPREVDVRFVGPWREFLDLRLRPPQVVVDIAEVASSEQVVRLDAGMVQIPGQLSVAPRSVTPSRIRLRFYRLSRRSLPVVPRFGAGYGRDWTLVDSVRLEPARVEVSGPAARLASLSAVPTSPIPITWRDSSFSRLVPLDTAALRGLRVSARRVWVSGEVDPVVERVVAAVPVTSDPGVEPVPATVNVRVRGPRSVVRGLRVGDLRAVTDSTRDSVAAVGELAPVRMEVDQPNVQVTPVPSTVRLVPRRLPVDSLPMEGG